MWGREKKNVVREVNSFWGVGASPSLIDHFMGLGSSTARRLFWILLIEVQIMIGHSVIFYPRWASARSLQVCLPIVDKLNSRRECTELSDFARQSLKWLSWCWISKPFYSFYRTSVLIFESENCLKLVVVEISFVRQPVAQLKSPVLTTWPIGTIWVRKLSNPKLFVVLWSF